MATGNRRGAQGSIYAYETAGGTRYKFVFRDARGRQRLLELLPAAEAAARRLDEADADVQMLTTHVDDLTDSGRGEVAEALRPFYLEYLRQHGVHAS